MKKRKLGAKPGRCSAEGLLPHPGSIFQRALDFHQAGNLDQAEALYRNILRTQPRHFDALLFLGHLYLNSGRIREAVEATTKAIAINSRHAVAHFNLGVAQLNLGNSTDAVASFDRAIALMPNYAEALCNRGMALQNLENHKEALQCFEQVIKWQPGSDVAYNNRGISLQKLGRHLDALASFDKVLEIKGDNAVAYNNRGISLMALKRHEEALESLRKAVELIPHYVEALNNCGLALQCLGRDGDAVAMFEKVLVLDSNNSMAYNNLGMSLLKLGQVEKALASLDRSLGTAPGSAEVYNNRGVAFQSLGRHEEALACFDQAIAFKQGDIDALNNRGNVLRDMNRNRDALAAYDQALKADPDLAHSHLNYGLCQLLLGNFARGWQEFEWRWQTDLFREAKRNFSQPLWLGQESLEGKTILLHAEQGFGDTIQFCRFGKAVADKGARVVMEVQSPLKRLLTNVAGVSRVMARDEPLPEYDYHCPLLSLPLALGVGLDQIPSSHHYLASDPEVLAKWQARLGEQTGVRIGLAWAGNADFGNDRNRSIPLAAFASVLSNQAQFVSLQKEIRVGDRSAMAAHPGIADFGADLHDFADTAAIVAQMDLVISVDTAIAHLAGAMGKPVWILLPFNSDWRWLTDRSDSPWYPSARLFRQPRVGDWDSVIRKVAAELSLNTRSDRPLSRPTRLAAPVADT